MALLAALGGRALRREPLRQAAEASGIVARLLDDPAAACQPSAPPLRGAFDAQVSCKRYRPLRLLVHAVFLLGRNRRLRSG